MMRLSTLWKVDQTIDAVGGSPIASAILSSWDYDPGSIQFFRSSANFVYRFRHEGRRYFLRFAADSERTRDDLTSEVALLQWLDGEGITAAQPIPSRAGQLVETVETDLGVFHAVVFVGLDGVHYDIDEIDLAQISAWGTALGRLHSSMASCPPAISSARRTCQDRLSDAQQWVEGVASVREEYQQLSAALDRLPVNPSDYGVIHFDFELDNLVWNEQTVGMLDFDHSGRGWYDADIAFALRDLFDNGAGLDHQSVRAFLNGYASYRSLDDNALDRLPLFSRLARLLIYADVVRSLDLRAEKDYPDWLNGLIGRFESWVQDYERTLETRD